MEILGMYHALQYKAVEYMANKGNKAVRSIYVEPEVWDLAKKKHYNMSAYIMDLIKRDMKYDSPHELVKAKMEEHKEGYQFYKKRYEEQQKTIESSSQLIEREEEPLNKAIESVKTIIEERGTIAFMALTNVAKHNDQDPFKVLNNLPKKYKEAVTGVTL